MVKDRLTVLTLFSGYDSQCLALERLSRRHPGFSYELLGWSEIDAAAVAAHDVLFPRWSGRNLGDITQVDWESHPELMGVGLATYSFPCTNISTAGRQAGFERGSGTASSLLWECERAFEVLRPRVLLMENVKALTQKKFMPLFREWIEVLRRMGYRSYWKVQNAKDFGVPQNRERVFMVSVLGDGPDYEFPNPFPLERRLRDVLEPKVDESFYLKPEQVQRIVEHCERKVAEGCGFRPGFVPPSAVSHAITSNYGQRETDPYLKEYEQKDAIDD